MQKDNKQSKYRHYDKYFDIFRINLGSEIKEVIKGINDIDNDQKNIIKQSIEETINKFDNSIDLLFPILNKKIKRMKH